MARMRQQFCKHEHDTFICGRYKSGGCKDCQKTYDRIDPTKDSRIKSICVNGHDISKCGRDTKRRCRLCANGAKKEWYVDNIDIAKEKNNQWKREHKEEVAEYIRIWVSEHRELVNNNRKKYVAKYPGRVRQQALEQDTNRNLRIVPWGQEGIEEFYDNKPKGMEGDHIIPLQGRKVSGLHVRWNLQYLTKSENDSKHNKCTPEEATKFYEKILIEAGLK